MKRLIEKFEGKMVDINYANTDELERHELGNPKIFRIEGAKVIIYIFKDYLENWLVAEYPPELYDKLVYYVKCLKVLFNENIEHFCSRSIAIYKAAIIDGEEILKDIRVKS